jgi:pimeloyl-ACP methyl ester carboxylesterase
VQFVEVETGVKLEVLDWGGTGLPLVLLTGLGDTAHVFDTFAPKLTTKYHVYGITRRGFGDSSTPPVTAQAYTADRLGDDVVAVFDKLKLERPVVVGHSIAGQELSSICNRHSERVAGLVYMEAGSPFALYPTSQEYLQVDWNEMRNDVEAITKAPTAHQQQALIAAMLKSELPRYERQLTERQQMLSEFLAQHGPDAAPPANPSLPVLDAIQGGERRYTEIKCPALAIFSDPPATGNHSADVQAKYLAQQRVQEKDFEAQGPQVHVVQVSGATHYIFRSNEADVLREINAFIAAVKGN